ncbi:MAG: DUF3048 domain-containing protein [Peptococcia bacterium]|jgi:hypothetical protein
MKKKYVIWSLLAFFLSVLLGSVTFNIAHPYFRGEKTLHNKETEDNPNIIEGDQEYPFAGWKDKPRQRALVVVIDNSVKARPQAGLERADVVVEFPVEGGLTRFVAVINIDDMDLIGPIRSARPYIVDLAKEYKGILIHAGGSEDALKILEEGTLEHFDEINGGVQVASSFWRIPDREKPHNLFTSSDVLRHTIKKLKLNSATLSPQRPLLSWEEEIQGNKVENINIYYAHKSSAVSFSYHEEQGVFYRYIEDNQPHLTYLGEHLKVANVIIQIVPFRYTDGDGHLQLIMHGEGEALIFRKGTVIEGRWKKTPGGFTEFIDKQGKIVPLLEGPTWIAVVPRGLRIDY